jgi:hypothetical protein
MFVEIMGLQMNTERLNAAKSLTKQKKFTFPADLPPPPGGWPEDLMWPVDDENDSLPDLEEIPDEERSVMIQLQKDRLKMIPKIIPASDVMPPVPGTKAVEIDPNAPVTGIKGIDILDWSALERAAIEDALEQEERIRKDRKKTNKKKSNAAEAAEALQKVEAANKKLDKAVGAWRNRVATATLQNETIGLKTLLSESPLQALQTSTKNQHLEFLVQHTVPKNAKVVKGAESRMILAKYLLADFSPVHMYTLSRNGRSAMHTACFFSDIPLLKLIVEESAKKLGSGQLVEKLDETCLDSGWTALMYAVFSGSIRTVEALFAACPDFHIPADLCSSITNDTHTWKKGTNKGVTARYLAEALLTGKYEKLIETHGMALQEVIVQHKLDNDAPNLYLLELGRIVERLQQIEISGYTPMDEKEITAIERSVMKEFESSTNKRAAETGSVDAASQKVLEATSQIVQPLTTITLEDADAKSVAIKKSKKKKNKKDKETSTSISSDAATNKAENLSGTSSRVDSETSKPREDPLITALKGMGFEETQILAGVKACGGIHRATADDVVAWIFGGGDAPKNDSAPGIAEDEKKIPALSFAESDKKHREEDALREQERLAAEKLAAKREEQRRRNREWNNRAQARQQLEAQEKLAKAAELRARAQPSALAPASNSLPSGTTSGMLHGAGQYLRVGQAPNSSSSLKMGFENHAPSVSSATRQTSHLRLGGDFQAGQLYFNDGSTGASSVDHGTIEIPENDDATVSTISSFPAVPPPLPASYMPQTFSDAKPMGREPPLNQRWERTRSGQIYSFDSSYVPMVPRTATMGPPPGIAGFAEHEVTLNSGVHHLQGVRSTSFGGVPTAQAPRYQNIVASCPTMAHPGGSSLFGESDPTFHPHVNRNDVVGSALFRETAFPPPLPSSGIMERALTAPAISSAEDPFVPGLLGFASNMNQSVPQQQSSLDSTLIESISTGNDAIGGATLWGDTPAPTSGSSLLGNLIHNLPDSSNPESDGNNLFPSSTFQSSDPSTGSTRWNQQSHNSAMGGSNIW